MEAGMEVTVLLLPDRGAGTWRRGKVWVSMADTGETLCMCDLPGVCVSAWREAAAVCEGEREKGLLCLRVHGGSWGAEEPVCVQGV